MTGLLDEIAVRYAQPGRPFILGQRGSLCFQEVNDSQDTDLSAVAPGEVVALIGEFDARSIATMLRLIDRQAILVPLTVDTEAQHPYFFEQAGVTVTIRGGQVTRERPVSAPAPLLEELRRRRHAGLILFSSGTTGRPKAILHDFSSFLVRYRTPRPTWRTLAFLRFDHIGGINTLLHTLYNGGVLIVPSARTPQGIADDARRFEAELLPATPTFLRLMLLADVVREELLPSLRVITYGTERMDQATLDQVTRLLPQIDFRQTYGMSELGILRVKSRARDSLWIQVGGEGVATRVREGVLQIKSPHRMLGYLNAADPFEDGWYDTGDLAEHDGDYIKIVGRSSDVINVGGLKVLPSEVERVALLHPEVVVAKAAGVANPLTGQHIEVTCQLAPGSPLDRHALRQHFAAHLPPDLRPQRVRIGDVRINHRFKQQ